MLSHPVIHLHTGHLPITHVQYLCKEHPCVCGAWLAPRHGIAGAWETINKVFGEPKFEKAMRIKRHVTSWPQKRIQGVSILLQVLLRGCCMAVVLLVEDEPFQQQHGCKDNHYGAKRYLRETIRDGLALTDE